MASFSSRIDIPPVTKNLLVINIMLWLVEFIFPGFAERTLLPRLGLHYIGSDLFNPAQLFTYMFLHDPSGITHIFFNMFSLWMFGRILERVWGGKRYLLFYLVCGVGAAFAQEAVWAMTWRHEYIQGIAALNGLTYDHMQQIVDQATAAGDSGFLAGMADMKSRMMTVGASGAIFGLLLGFAFVFPNMPLYLFFIPVPIKAKYFVIGYALIELYAGFANSAGDNVAHFAHLGGMVFGFILIMYWRKKNRGNGYYYN